MTLPGRSAIDFYGCRIDPDAVPTACLVQPEPRGQISGGYLYNERIAAHGAWALRNASAGSLEDTLREAAGDCGRLFCDSLWLAPETIDVLPRLAREGFWLGLVLHALPSQLEPLAWQEAALVATRQEQRALRSLAKVVLPGPYYLPMLEQLGVASVIAAPGIDAAWRVPPRPRSTPVCLVSVGAVAPHKGSLDVLEILAASGRDDLRYEVIGSLDADRAYAARVQERARTLPQVMLLGQQSREQVRARLREADLLLMPSYCENHPLVLLEALAASVPVVGYAAGGSSQIIEHGVHGLLAQVGDRTSLAAHLFRLLDDESLRARMAAACFARQRALPSWAETAAALADALSA